MMLNEAQLRAAANTIRFLSADGVQKANSGHPGMPMGMADCAAVLWLEYLKFNPQEPQWPNRDRFVLSGGHGSMLLYSLLYLAGFDVTMDDLKSFRQWGSKTAGHPEYGLIPGIETTTGPLGQGFSNAVGMAIAAKMSAARFNAAQHNIFGAHYVYAFAGDGDMMEGVTQEAASLAGHLGLGNLIVFYDNNGITIEGKTELAFSEDVAKRFQALGWQTIEIDGHNYSQIAQAIEAGQKEKEKPTLILAKTHIGFGAPEKQDTAEAHGAPLGVEELKAAKRNLHWPEQDFYVPDEVTTLFQNRINELKKEYDSWKAQFQAWEKANPDLSKEWHRQQARELPENLEEELLASVTQASGATRSISGTVMQKIVSLLPEFVGGSADLHPSTNTLLKNKSSISKNSFSGNNFHFGIREHGMGSILNGIALYGGFIPFGATFFVFSDYMRPPIRLAALMELPVVYVFTHDSIFVGEDGPTHQPVEQLVALRAIMNLVNLRPCDAQEVALAWAYALRRKDGPTALMLTRQKVGAVNREKTLTKEEFAKGGYILKKEKGNKADVVLVASGSEVPVAMEAAPLLEANYSVRVVSMPSRELFLKQSKEKQEEIVPASARVVVVEAARGFGWGDVFRQPLLVLGIERFGASGPEKVLAEKFGYTGSAVATNVTSWLQL
ncbi:MAG TPA: transketolase [Bacteroidota bacterium]|nr:transketolase [Bacteroidota bacterium]